MADLAQFSGDSPADGELSFDELEWVSAAGSGKKIPALEDILRRGKEK